MLYIFIYTVQTFGNIAILNVFWKKYLMLIKCGFSLFDQKYIHTKINNNIVKYYYNLK